MKTQIKFYLVLVSMLCIAGSAFDQLTVEEENMLKKRAAEKTAQMNDYITFMAKKDKTYDNRVYYKGKALNLFIGKGYKYEEDGVEKEGVMMEITSTKRKETNHRLMRDYFESLIKLGYSEVDIQSTKIPQIKVSNLKQTGSNTYECTCEYDQYFTAYRDRIVVYKDKTTKRIKCIIEQEDTEDGKEYIVMLGDVTALEIKKL